MSARAGRDRALKVDHCRILQEEVCIKDEAGLSSMSCQIVCIFSLKKFNAILNLSELKKGTT
mgnify:CR=1 FL=1